MLHKYACYFGPGRVRSIAMSVYVCLSLCMYVCPLAYGISKDQVSKLHEIFCPLPVPMARSSDNYATRHVLPVPYDVMFAHSWPYGAWGLDRIFKVIHQTAAWI